MTLKEIFEFWDRFWFEKRSPAPICLFRICYGLLVLAYDLAWMPDLLTFFGPRGMVTAGTMQMYMHMQRFSLFSWLPQTDSSVVLLAALLAVSAVFVSLGFLTRTSLVVCFLCLVSFHHRNVMILHSGDTFLRVLGFFLIFSDAGKMFSIDRRLHDRKLAPKPDQWQTLSYIWPTRLLQLQIAALYCQTFWGKIAGESWRQGTAIYYALRLEDFQRFPVPYIPDHLWACQLLTWGTLAVELSLFTLIWIKEFRYWVLLAGLCLHLGIEWAMNIPFFELTMIASYLIFIEPADLKRVLEGARSKLQAKLARPELPDQEPA